ncbi:unnamed protein product [Auanema sp. JU1783]|nr:unnamed protein product [Auanema sp. JU1783]
MLNWLLLFSTVCVVLAFKVPNFFASQTSIQAFQKYLEETCQTVNDSDLFIRYRDWELHMFIESLRAELLPETENGDLRAYMRSPLSKVMPLSPLLGELEPERCSKSMVGKTKLKSDKAVTKAAFQDFLIDLWV